jgi:hypothetical protein
MRKLAGWFEEMEKAAWDEEMERDFAPGGKGEWLAKEIRREISEGKARPLARRRPCMAKPLPVVILIDVFSSSLELLDVSYAARHHA